MAATDPSGINRPAPTRWRRFAPRLLVPTDRADLRVTWHQDDDLFVLSLWHRDACVGTAPLNPRDAAEVASFVVAQLGQRNRWTPRVVDPRTHVHPARQRPLLQRLLERVRRHI